MGRAINPALVEGQLTGAAVQGIAGALLEELPYDDDGPAAGRLARRLPVADRRRGALGRGRRSSSTRCRGNPLGVKGAGEAGIVGAPAAVANAVADALPPGAGRGARAAAHAAAGQALAAFG